MRQAAYFSVLPEAVVRCELCPHHCIIRPGERGACRVRENQAGVLYARNYGVTTGIALDPVEKKTLAHFHPGEYILSAGTWGCNLKCFFCQNWRIAQAGEPECAQAITAAELIRQAQAAGSFGIAYTYNEPAVWFEFVRECAPAARQAGLDNVLVTNGYICREPLRELLPYIGAMNIDIKAMDDEFYRQRCRGSLAPVLETIITAKQHCHVELTNLVIPTLNDRDEHFVRLADWISRYAGADTPLHVSRYFPCYRAALPPTPRETLERAYALARRKLKFVYVGNV
ncbi:MAG: AmmeMemoRadiSam system radical SAM enzyme [Candidatus Omnitrophica bacterium]|nr:AmmeMemoRadiSam system radical SAM enzyme [Candidatus Omnitrophota bacterium]